MKLLGRDVDPTKLVEKIEERLRERGLLESPVESAPHEPEGPVNPLTFNLHALEEHADPTVGLPLESHRTGAGRLVLVVKWAFRTGAQVFINEALSRQRVFNGHVRDSYAQLSSEVLRLRQRVEELEREKARAGRSDRPSGSKTKPKA